MQTATIASGRQVSGVVIAALCLSCSPIEVTINPHAVPNTGSNRLALNFAPGQRSTFTTALIDQHELLIDHQPEGSFIDVPKLEAGDYQVALDNQKTTAKLSVYDAELLIEFIDVGQGDAILLIAPTGLAYLIDTGPVDSSPVIQERLDAHGIQRIEKVILTHTDADHIGGLADLLKGSDGLFGSADDLSVGAIVEDGTLSDRTTRTARTLNALIDERLQRIIAMPGDRIEGLGGFVLHTISAAGATRSRPATPEAAAHANARSITTTVCLDDWCGWLGGDLTGGGLSTPNVEQFVLGELRPMVFVKVPHHGSRSSSSRALVEALSPRLAVVSLGTNNDHCHPTPEVLARWSQTATVLSTGAGQTGNARCDATAWPTTSYSNCGTITLRKGYGSYAQVHCAEQNLSF